MIVTGIRHIIRDSRVWGFLKKWSEVMMGGFLLCLMVSGWVGLS